jgi:subtilisin family serine protease
MKLLLPLTLLLISAGLAGQGLIGEQLSRSIETSVEQNLEGAVEDGVSQQVQSGVENAIEESVTDTLDQAVEQTVAQRISEAVDTQVQETVQGSVDNAVGEAVSAQIAENVSSGVAEAVAAAAAASADEAAASIAAGAVATGVQQAVTATVESATAGAVAATVDNAVAGALTGLPLAVDEPLTALDDVLDDSLPVVGALSQPTPVVSDAGETLFYEVDVENNWRAVQGEWLTMAGADQLNLLRRAGVQILETRDYPELGMTLVRFRVAEHLDSQRALEQLLPDAQSLERNHIYSYRPQAGVGEHGAASPRKSPVCEDATAIGLVDTAVASDHPFLRHAAIRQRDFLPGAMRPPRDHGSAVAGILVAKGDGIKGAIPNGRLAVASVMYQRRDGSQGATAMSLLEALEWLVQQEVSVINLSLAGPPNRLVEAAVGALVKQGVRLVAAVGNDGPAAPPLYPAAYEGVIGVTAVDASGQVYRWANRGPQVDFSALGVGVTTLGEGGAVTSASGTSMAAPVVSAHVACSKAGDLTAVAKALTAKSADLGAPGRDDTYGFGLLE